MKKVIGIVGEGPTDYLVLKTVIDHITGEENEYRRLQPEPDAVGKYGNGWKGVWKWCEDTAGVLEEMYHAVIPQLDMLVIQMDADVSRTEKELHCSCDSVICENKGLISPLTCGKIVENLCPIIIPCENHENTPEGFAQHIEDKIAEWLKLKELREDMVIAVPCDSTDAWIVAAYHDADNVETIEKPWETIISIGKTYHGVRIPGHKKSTVVYSQLLPQLEQEWESVILQCGNARHFDEKIRKLLN